MNFKFITYSIFVVGLSTVLSWQDFLAESTNNSSGSSSYRSSSGWGGGHK